MTDQELRDKLASEFELPMPDAYLEPSIVFAYKAGWDAARVNDAINESLRRALDSALGWKKMLEKERDQLKADLEQSKAEVEKYINFSRADTVTANILFEENQKLKIKLEQSVAAAEKLAEALEQHEVPKNCAALAEYREKFPKDGK